MAAPLGSNPATRSNAVGSNPSYLPEANPGMSGGGTYTSSSAEPTIQDYENIFGPSARDIKTDLQRFKRHGRWHLPDVLKGPNPWLTDRIDGLITDATNSPFTTKILPYLYKEDVDGKIKWNVWSFDEGLASRVPYESAARTLTQSKRSFAGYMVRQGMAIVLEHNFMMSPKGRENFKNQLNQLIGSIQYTNDLDVHMALVLAPSYQKTMREKYYTIEKSNTQICRQFVDLFGMMQKNANALDILIEESKAILRTWGGPMPDFLLCNSKLTFQMTMTPDKTNYVSQGPDGVKRLKQGPDIGSYRGLSVIHSRAFAMETGQHPRDILRRRVRTAEYYRIPPSKDNIDCTFELYNEERDTWFSLTFKDLLRFALIRDTEGGGSANSMALRQAYEQAVRLEKERKDEPGAQKATRMMGMLGAGMDEGFIATEHETTRNSVALAVGERLREVASLANKGFYLDTWLRYDADEPVLVFPFAPMNMGLRLQAAPNSYIAAGREVIRRESPRLSWLKGLPKVFPDSTEMVVEPNGFTPGILAELYHKLKSRRLYVPCYESTSDPVLAVPGSADWYRAYTFYTTVFRRHGVFMDALQFNSTNLNSVAVSTGCVISNVVYEMLGSGVPRPEKDCPVDRSNFFLHYRPVNGNVNHELHLNPFEGARMDFRCNINAERVAAGQTRSFSAGEVFYDTRQTSGAFIGGGVLLTWELMKELLQPMRYNDEIIPLIEVVHRNAPLVRNFRPDPEVISAWQNVVSICNRPLDGAGTISNLAPYLTTEVHADLHSIIQYVKEELLYQNIASAQTDQAAPLQAVLAEYGIDTWPMGHTSLSRHEHPLNNSIDGQHFKDNHRRLDSTYGHLNLAYLETYQQEYDAGSPWLCMHNLQTVLENATNFDVVNFNDALACTGDLLQVFHSRLFNTPAGFESVVRFADARFEDTRARTSTDEQKRTFIVEYVSGNVCNHDQGLVNYIECVTTGAPERRLSTDPSIGPNVSDAVLVIGSNRDQRVTPAAVDVREKLRSRLEDVEIVIVRPNIEHHMLGIIMGQGGSELGNTLWGQTELSVYDDSMHGIWGMSYKYHERAIVFNEKNLVRLWDIAYDGYNGGKDDTHVNWDEEDERSPNGYKAFKKHSVDTSHNYRGPSMMVMAFVHDQRADAFDSNFKRNWPSPIVFHDTYDFERGEQREPPLTLPVDCENIEIINADEYRVFNNPLYQGYSDYREKMPGFNELHKVRKGAGQSSVDSDTPQDSLAFQGSMRIKKNGALLQEIQGSGHHGPDYVGVASVRAGKGQKVQSQAPSAYRLI